MVTKGIINYPENKGELKNGKIKYFNKIKTNEENSAQIIFDNTSPEIVKQAKLFLSKKNMHGFATSLKGIYLQKGHNLVSKEYIKEGDDWILFVNFTNNNQTTTEETNIAITYISGIFYLTSNGIKKVFIVQRKFTANFGFIDLEQLNEYMLTQEDKTPYKIDNSNQEMFIVDAPTQLFAKDSTPYKDGNFIGVWISFGTFIKYDVINFSNLNIDGDEVSLIDNKIKKEDIFKKMLENKSAGLGSVIVDTEKLLSYLLKHAKETTFNLNKMKYDRVCIDDILYNLSKKGILGITYDEVDSIENMYLPIFDYTTAKVKDVVGEALLFIYKDEYLWINMSDDKKEMHFMSYKGNVYNFSNDTFKVTVYNNPVLTKLNKVNDENFLLFSGFSNLENNAVMDFYFDDTTEFFSSKDRKFSLEVNAFDDYYTSATKYSNSLYFDDKTLFKIYGNNKYHLITGLVYGNVNSVGDVVTKIKPNLNYRTFTDVKNKETYVCNQVIENYGYTSLNGGNNLTVNFFYEYIRRCLKTGNISLSEMERVFSYAIIGKSYFNGWLTFKNKKKQYITLKTETDKNYEFIYGSYAQKVKDFMESLISRSENGEKINVFEESKMLLKQYNSFLETLKNVHLTTLKHKISKTHKISDINSPRFLFNKVSDDLYVLNKPVDEICNHAVLNEKKIKDVVSEKDFKLFNNFFSPYIKTASVKTNKNIVSISPFLDNSDPIDVVSYIDFGITINEAFKTDIKYTKTKFKCFIKNEGKKIIDGAVYDIFAINHGFQMTIDFSGIEKDSEITNNKTLKNTKNEKTLLKQEIKQLNAENKNPFTKIHKNIEQSYSVEDNFVPVGDTILVAFASGKIMTSIGGDEWYQPFNTNNGLRISNLMYIDNIDTFESVIQNLILTDKQLLVTEKAIIHKEDIVDVNQIKIEHMNYNIDTQEVFVKFHFVDIYGVIDDILYSPKTPITKVIKVDVDFDKVIESKRVIYVEPTIEYKTVFPIDKRNKYADASGIINHENCFSFYHQIPIAFSLNDMDYILASKEEAINSGARMFFNLRDKEYKLNDIFNNYNIEIVNGLYKDGEGIFPKDNEEIFIKIIPNKDDLVRFLKSDEIFLVSSYDASAYEIGIAYNTSDTFEPINSAIIHENQIIQYWISVNNEKIHNSVPFIEKKHQTNTFGLMNLKNNLKIVSGKNLIPLSSKETYIDGLDRKTDLCFYIKSKHPIYSMYSGKFDFIIKTLNKKEMHKIEVQNLHRITEYPELFFKK